MFASSQHRKRVAFAAASLAALAAAIAPAASTAPATAAAPRTTAALAPPPVPTTGAYLGAYYSPVGPTPVKDQIASVASTYASQIGRDPAILSVYQSWAESGWIPNTVLNEVAYDLHAVPMVNWACGVIDADIVNGSQDTLITQYADQLKAYGLPVFVRWFWEMNLTSNAHYASCLDPSLALAQQESEYIAAFRRVVTLFRAAGATNVSFVWAPSTSPVPVAVDPTAFYPGNAYVDWIGGDGFDRPGNFLGTGAFADQFQTWYSTFSSGTYGKPLIVTETASPVIYYANPTATIPSWTSTCQAPPSPADAVESEQACYVTGVAHNVPTQFPDIKALVYFDAPTSDADWDLASQGLSAMAALGATSYFGYVPTVSVPPSTCAAAANQALYGAPTVLVSTGNGICPGYAIASAFGRIADFGTAARYHGLSTTPNQPIVAASATADNGGYWLGAADGGVFAFGDARFYGSMGGVHLNEPVVGMATTPDGLGYWLVAADGGIFSFGDAKFYGSTGAIHLNKPVVAMAPTADGKGYWLAASDGGIFAFGDAGFRGSMGGTPLNRPVVGITADPAGTGYRLVASDGGIFSFGAPFYGSLGGLRLSAPIEGMAPSNVGNGYLLLASDGGVFPFGDATFLGRATITG